MAHLRELTTINDPYHKFNREERHLAAILFHLLQDYENVRSLLTLAKLDWEIRSQEEFGIYFEYALIRDLWAEIGPPRPSQATPAMQRAERDEANRKKHAVILGILRTQFQLEIIGHLEMLKRSEDILAFNKFFTGSPKYLKEIVSPSKWRIDALAGGEPRLSDTEVMTAAKIKWAFNAKPDLVIHTDCNHALCLELKLESDEDRYTGDTKEREALVARGLYGPGRDIPMPQTKIQEFLMSLLGIKTCFRTVSREKGSSNECALSWDELFSVLKIPPSPYIQSAVNFARSGRGRRKMLSSLKG